MKLTEITERVDANCTARAIDADGREARFLSQSAALGTDKLVILPYAGRKRSNEFMKNPIVVPYHLRMSDTGEPLVIGKVTQTEFNDEGMFQTIRYAESDLGQQWWELVRDEFINMVSIAWWPDYRAEWEPEKMVKVLGKANVKLKDAELAGLQGVIIEYRQKDLSMVAIGADPKAMRRIADEGNEVAGDILDNYRWVEDESNGLILPDGLERSVIPFKSYALAPASQKWDGPGEVRKASVEDLMKICTWYDKERKDVKGAYKLPHHTANGYKTVWNGVKAAMGATLGARGGLKGVPENERKGIYNHLAKHYKEFDKEPPEYRSEVDEDYLRELIEEGLILLPENNPSELVLTTRSELTELITEVVESVLDRRQSGGAQDSQEESNDEEPKPLRVSNDLLNAASDIVDKSKGPQQSMFAGLLKEAEEILNKTEQEKEN